MDPSYPYSDIAAKVALATGVGLLVGLEREWSKKEVGVRSFAITALVGMLATLLASEVVIATLCSVILLSAFLNIQSLLKDRSLELTTSISLVVVFILGALVGRDHYFAAATSAIVMVFLLSGKLELRRFAGALRPQEIRSAVLLGLISVVIYPLLPDRFVDPWELVNPYQSWTVVIAVAGIGFVNYVLLRIYRTKGVYYSALLGGFVNSTAAVAELARLLRNNKELASGSLGILLLTNVAMFLRNGVILGIFAPQAFAMAIVPLLVMTILSAAFSMRRTPPVSADINLSSPVSLTRVLKFGVLFLLLSIAATVAQRRLGHFGLLVVSALGGLISSASTTASAATLAATGQISGDTGAWATVLTSMASAVASIPLAYQQSEDKVLTSRLIKVTALVIACGFIAAAFHVESL